MPGWLQAVAKFVPVTYSLDGLRLAILKGYSLSQLSSQALVLLCIDAVFLPLSLFVFAYAVDQAKKNGSLVYY
ncbi:MAG: hypothetical protein JW795_17450 [Chitinivibrionales bacterium]|nr:hypothetical protein [Chitinivibrionales bacterium]